MNQQTRIAIGLQHLALFVMASWIVVPIVNVSRQSRYAVLAAAFVWIVLECLAFSSSLFRFSASRIALVLMLMMVLLLEYFDGGWRTVRSHIPFTIAGAMLFIGIQLSYRRPSSMLWPVVAILSLFAISGVTTLSKLSEDVWAARAVVRVSDRSEELMNENVGGYLLVYMASALCPLLWYTFLQLRGVGGRAKIFRVTVFISLVVSSAVVLKASYAIALLTAFGGCVIVSLPGRFDRPAYWFIGIGFSLVLIAGADAILDWAKAATRGTPMHQKVIALDRLAESGRTEGGFAGRLGRYSRSIRLWAEHPLLGAWSRRSVGKHSTVLDTFAEFGLLGGSLLCVALFAPLWRLYQTVNSGSRKCVAAVAFCVLGHALFNNLMAGTTLVAYVLMPFAIATVENPEILRPQRVHRRAVLTGHQGRVMPQKPLVRGRRTR